MCCPYELLVGGLVWSLLPLHLFSWASSLLQISYRCALIYTPSFTTEPNIQSKHVHPTVEVYHMQEEELLNIS